MAHLITRFISRSTSLARIFARDILLYYSYIQSYEATAQKLFWFSSCHHGVERRRPLPWPVVDGRPHPAHRRDPDTMGIVAICSVGRFHPPQPEKIHADGTKFFRDFFNAMITDN